MVWTSQLEHDESYNTCTQDCPPSFFKTAANSGLSSKRILAKGGYDRPEDLPGHPAARSRIAGSAVALLHYFRPLLRTSLRSMHAYKLL